VDAGLSQQLIAERSWNGDDSQATSRYNNGNRCCISVRICVAGEHGQRKDVR
jgi:hypothetical protein